jgi:hypothetical protein
VLLENPIVAQLVKKFPAFSPTQRFISVFIVRVMDRFSLAYH